MDASRANNNNRPEGMSTAILLHPWPFTTMHDLIALMDAHDCHGSTLTTERLKDMFGWAHPGEICRFQVSFILWAMSCVKICAC